MLATASKASGSIVFWDLNKQKVHSIIPAAHNSNPVSHLQFLGNEAALISTSGADNSLKMWVFESGLT